jgi:hypothetical protein
MNKNNQQKNNKTKVTLSILVLAFLIMVGAVSFWYYQIIQGSIKIREDKKIYNQELKDSRLISEIRRQKERLDEINVFLDSLYIPEDNAVSFIEYIESVADDAGVSLDIKKFDIENGDLLMNIEVVGGWSQINRLLVMIENLPYYTVIEKFNLSVSNAGEGVLWRADFDIKGLTK